MGRAYCYEVEDENNIRHIKGNTDEYSGSNDRRSDPERSELTDESQAVVNAITKRIKSCINQCPIPKEAQSAVPKFTGTIAEIGNGNYYKGIDRIRDNYRESNSFFEWVHNTKSLIWKIIITALVLAVIGWVAAGFYQDVARRNKHATQER